MPVSWLYLEPHRFGVLVTMPPPTLPEATGRAAPGLLKVPLTDPLICETRWEDIAWEPLGTNPAD
jgi:hypothetical protein